MKNILIILLLNISVFSTIGCQNIKTREDIEAEKAQQNIPPSLRVDHREERKEAIVPDYSNTQTQHSTQAEPSLPAPTNVSRGDTVRLGIILGPGGLRTFAHIGLLQELVKAKIPVYSVAGMEMGSLVAAIYAKKGQAFDVEWQMMKLKEEEIFKKNLVSRGVQDTSQLHQFLQTSLGGVSVEDAKINFSCPAFHLTKRQIFIMNRGPFTSVLPYCLPAYPFFKPHQQNIAGLTSLVTTVKHLKTKGVNYFVYVDLLNEKSTPFFQKIESEENVNWSMVAQSIDQQLGVVNKVVSIQLNYYLDDFSKRRELIQKGQEVGRQLVKDLQSDLGY